MKQSKLLIQVAIAIVSCLASSHIALADPLRVATPPTQFCDQGVFQIGEDFFSFDDIKVEGVDAIGMGESKKVVAFTYLWDVKMPDNLYQDDAVAKMHPGKECSKMVDGNIGVGIIDPMFDVVFAPGAFNFDKDRIKQIRKLLKDSNMKELSGMSLKMYKIEGAFAMYSDANQMYFQATGIDVVGSSPSLK